MPIISAKDNENNRKQRKTKEKDKKEQRDDASYCENVRAE